MSSSRKHTMQGFTLSELMITIAIVSIISALAAPSFSETIDKRRVDGVSEPVKSLLSFARSENISRQSDFFISFDTSTSSADWCVGVSMSANCDCNASIDGNNACVVDGQLKVIKSDGSGNVQLSTTFANDETSFSAPRGGASETGDIVISSTSEDRSTTLSINRMGRIYSCTAEGSSTCG